MWIGPDPERLTKAAEGAIYMASDYLCPGPDGRIKARVKPATPCPRKWTNKEAKAALKRAINAGYVSKTWVGDYPRYVWYRDVEETIYEAVGECKTPHRFHAYPVEASRVPKALQW